MSTETGETPWLSDLNPEQRDAVRHIDGPLLVVAGAGSGKTRTIAYRVAYLMASGVQPERIMLLTFTRRAAEEMVRRAAEIAERGAAVAGKVWGGTFHATANRLLRIYAKAADLPENFTVMDESDSEDMLNVVRHEAGFGSKERRFPRKSACRAIYSRCVDGETDLKTVLEKDYPWCIEWHDQLKILFRKYVQAKQQNNVLDYDDLLLYWAEMLAGEHLARQVGDRFDHILVDEYQDTNRLQARILMAMRRFNNNIMAVGDDAQSIYSFRGATVRNMLDFPRHFPGARIVTLTRNYRSVAPILDTTNVLISAATERYAKDLTATRGAAARPKLVTCKDEHAQDEYVIARVLEHYEQGVPLRKQAVLFRAGNLSDSLEVELARRKIPFQKYGGLRFLEAAHVKDLVSFLRVAENPHDQIAWFRLLNLADGVGPATAARAVQHVMASGWDPASIGSFQAPPAAADTLAAMAAMFHDLAQLNSKNPASQIERIRRLYDPLLKKIYDNPRARTRDMESLEQIASGYKSRGRFLTDLQLDPPRSTGDLAGPPSKDEDWLVLSTIHSAKGCEWDAVYLIHAADGCLPSDMATGSAEELEEELRLTYVAMTRARDFLYITWPLRYYHKWLSHGDSHSYAQLCRFINDDVKATLDIAVESGAKGGADEVAPSSKPRDIRASLLDRWS